MDAEKNTRKLHTKDTAEVKKNINRSLQEQYSRERNATDFAEVYDARKRRQELEAMYNEISQMGEVIKTLHFRIFVPGRSLVDLEERVGLIMKNLESDGFIPTILLNEGKREWQSLFKSFTEQHKEPFYIKGQPLTTEQQVIRSIIQSFWMITEHFWDSRPAAALCPSIYGKSLLHVGTIMLLCVETLVRGNRHS